ncbi:hypothetical protein K458DRAFT_462793, partial [Lentithecium fluviatile CBS 122367]
EIVTLDDWYDATLVVGAKDRRDGLEAFRASKTSLRMGSEPFSAMLFGGFAESNNTEIYLEDDNPQAFLIVLQICYHKYEELPVTLSQSQLLELAVLSDKYDLTTIISPFIK